LLVLPALLAIEYALRALLSVFTPANPDVEPDMLADSLAAGLWRWPLRPLHNLHNELQQRFGIDLRQNWAFGFVRRALLPVLGAMVMVAWLLSGMAEIPIAERGIYERFGKPVAVWTPGLHAGLPWPFARVRRVELGVIHELATASAMPDDNQAAAPVELTSADGLAPASANRLWDASHVAEKSQVIAGRAGDKQSFHVVNMDVRFMYRIGLDDAAALAATYNSSDVESLIRTTANRVLVRDVASRTLDGVLGEARSQLAIDVGTQAQADLNALHSGVEILATVIEAIHPPAAAANAYHSVQAAQISAQAIIARERGKAAEQVNTAQLRAVVASSQADASARETVATAEASQLRFAAERDAYATAGKAFLFEQYLAQLTQGLATAQLVILDHRLRSAAPTIDLRPFGAPVDASARRVGP
jgi:regulator of protease activity HflC (stomatin/prohibitin superfamily)